MPTDGLPWNKPSLCGDPALFVLLQGGGSTLSLFYLKTKLNKKVCYWSCKIVVENKNKAPGR